jgi:branched-chain amino acid transport system ATP-binding protein
MLRARNLAVRYDAVVALDGVDFDVPERGTLLVIGPNGAGKTTLVNVVTRVTAPSAGTLAFDGRDLLRERAHALAGIGIGRSFQRAELFGHASVRDNVLVGLQPLLRNGAWATIGLPGARRSEREARERTDALLERLGLIHVRDVPAGALSHGHQKLVDLARALVAEPRLLVADEPFAGLTQAEIPRVFAALRAAANERAILLVEHHLDIVLPLADRVVVLDFGRRIAEGSPANIVRDPRVVESYLGTAGATG